MPIQFKNIKMKVRRSIDAMDLSMNNQYLAIGQQQPAKKTPPGLSIFEIKEDKKIKLINGISLDEDEMILHVKFCNNDNQLVYYQTTHEIKVFDLNLNEHLTIDFDFKHLQRIEASKTNGNVLISADQIKIWSIEEKEYIWEFAEKVQSKNNRPTTIGGLSYDGKFAAIGGTVSKEVLVYDIEKNSLLMRLQDGPEQCGRIYFFSDYVVCIGYLGEGIYLWDLNTGKKIYPEINDFGAFSISIVQNKNLMVIGGYSGYMMSINFVDEKLIFNGDVHKAKVVDLNLMNDGNTLISASEDGTISFINIEESIKLGIE